MRTGVVGGVHRAVALGGWAAAHHGAVDFQFDHRRTGAPSIRSARRARPVSRSALAIAHTSSSTRSGDVVVVRRPFLPGRRRRSLEAWRERVVSAGCRRFYRRSRALCAACRGRPAAAGCAAFITRLDCSQPDAFRRHDFVGCRRVSDTPSWWMPASWAKALRPTIALLGCTSKPVMVDSRREVSRMSIFGGDRSGLHGTASGRVADRHQRSLPGRRCRRVLPMPLHGANSTWRTPWRRWRPSMFGDDGHAEVVVVMGGPDDFVGAWHSLAQHGEDAGHVGGHGVADGIRDVDGGGAGGDRGFDGAAEEIGIAAGAVLGRPFDVVGVAAG